MSTSLAVVVTVVIAATGVAFVIGRLLTLRSGMLRAAEQAADVDTAGLDLSTEGPTIVHFSAPWCGPCAAVRRVAEQICADLPGVHHSEIDIDENPELAQRFSILSLPTTLIFDAAGKLRYRTSGVPRADELRTLLTPWLA